MIFEDLGVQMTLGRPAGHGLSQDLETRCPNEGFIDFWVSKAYRAYTTNEINHIYIYRFCF